jgi:hypothetical protein
MQYQQILSSIIIIIQFSAYLHVNAELNNSIRSRDSVVGIATGRVQNFLFCTSSRPDLGPTQLPIQWVPGALSAGVKRPGSEADHSPPASAEVKKM